LYVHGVVFISYFNFLLGAVLAMFTVDVLHFVSRKWGASLTGHHSCGPDLSCTWTSSGNMSILQSKWLALRSVDANITTVSLYNIHSWKDSTGHIWPDFSRLNTTLTMFESEESITRFGHIFAFDKFHGSSTPHPLSSVQRVYKDAHLNESQFLPMIPFAKLIRGGAYVVKAGHGGRAPSNRDSIIMKLRELGVRIDGLGRRLHTSHIPEGIDINVMGKSVAINRYLFYFAFENSVEPGYVTEKAFHGLASGTVPVYLGDARHLRTLIPDPKSVIFLEDFQNNVTALASYLLHLQSDEASYEAHRAWRHNYSYEQHVKRTPLLAVSWPCAVCRWSLSAKRRPRSQLSGLEALIRANYLTYYQTPQKLIDYIKSA